MSCHRAPKQVESRKEVVPHSGPEPKVQGPRSHNATAPVKAGADLPDPKKLTDDELRLYRNEFNRRQIAAKRKKL
jgi:hypothetical protein